MSRQDFIDHIASHQPGKAVVLNEACPLCEGIITRAYWPKDEDMPTGPSHRFHDGVTEDHKQIVLDDAPRSIMPTTEKKTRTRTDNEFRIAANIEAWFERLKPADRAWVLIKLNDKYGPRSARDEVLRDSRGPDRQIGCGPHPE